MPRGGKFGPTKLTPKKKEAFLAAIKNNVGITEAARQLGVTRQAFYKERDQNADFAAAYEEAKAECEAALIERLEKEADRRGVEGVVKPVMYKGQAVGTIREYSDTLLIFRLKGLAPERYRDNYKLDATVDMGDALAQLLERIAGSPDNGLDSMVK